jgi:hypothetical protein
VAVAVAAAAAAAAVVVVEKCSSEASVHFQRTTRRYITEDINLHILCRENLKFCKIEIMQTTLDN